MRHKSLFGSYFHDLVQGWTEECHALKTIIHSNLLAILCSLLIGLGLLLMIDPYPPGEFHLAMGQQGTSYQLLAEKFVDYFNRHGIKLVLDYSSGLDDGLNKIISEQSAIAGGFVTAGSFEAEQFENIVSLGSIQFSPVWLFYRGAQHQGEGGDDILNHLSKRIAIGADGTSTQKIFSDMAALRGVKLENQANFLRLSHLDAANKLKAGEIDAMFVVDSIDSPLITSLLSDHRLQVASFDLADAYTKKLSYLHKLSVPKGSIDLEKVYPRQDINLLGTTVTLLIEKGTHPVIQWIFLKCAKSISKSRQAFFAEPGFFPAYLDRSVPLSEVAKRFYESGLPPLAQYLPLWLADFIDRVWLQALTAVAIIYPFFQFLPGTRVYVSNAVLEDAYAQLRDLEVRVHRLDDIAAMQALMSELDELDHSISALWVSSDNIKNLFALKRTSKFVRDRIKERHASLIKPEA